MVSFGDVSAIANPRQLYHISDYQVNSIQDNHWNSKLVSELRDLLMHPLILANAIKLVLLTACQMSQPRKLFSLRKEIKTFILIHIVFLPSVCSWEPCQAV